MVDLGNPIVQRRRQIEIAFEPREKLIVAE